MEGMTLSPVVFYLLAAIAVVGAGGVAFSRNIIYSALSLMESFLGVAGLYVMLNADCVARMLALSLAVPGIVLLLPGSQVPALCAEHCEWMWGTACLMGAAAFAFGQRVALRRRPTPPPGGE